jgi:hypothetical protein
MNKTFAVLAFSAAALVVGAKGAEARKLSYEVNGQRYSYDSRDPKQVAAARKLIEAANTADAAKSKAESEKADNPLVGVFGSKAQREAEDAQAQLRQAASELGQSASPAQERMRAAVRTDARPEPATEQSALQSPVRERSAERTRRRSAESRQAAADPDEAPAPTGSALAVKSVFLDAATGIKTTILKDGTVREEPFDPGLLSAAGHEGTNSDLTGFVEQVRRSSPAETTGSTSPR